MGTRTQGERDATTVEIGYALFVATGLAVIAFFAVSAPADFFGVTSPSPGLLRRAGLIAAAVVFVATVATILLRHGRSSARARRRMSASAPGRDTSAQPSQPGRTRPDS
ncbi:DUF6332 family protein [Streptomyces silaceus]|uniref:DUF6332 family protein n=1 Tax=Streptomyces silaceus TaxID=545123 RepID=UPI0007C7E24C|nr:DUF6332 family protein [Streptomyces silaceus]